MILDDVTVNTNTEVVILKYNITKQNDGFSLGFTINFLQKIPTFYVSFLNYLAKYTLSLFLY